MHYISNILIKTQEDYSTLMEEHDKLCCKSFHGTNDTLAARHLVFLEKAGPLLMRLGKKRRKLGCLKMWDFLKEDAALGEILPSVIILKIANFVPEKVELK